MKILYQPDIKAWKYKCTCGICTSQLEASFEDLKYRPDKKWYSDAWGDGGYYANVDFYYVNCPVCTKEVNVHAGDLSYLLKEHVKKVYNENNQKSRHK